MPLVCLKLVILRSRKSKTCVRNFSLLFVSWFASDRTGGRASWRSLTSKERWQMLGNCFNPATISSLVRRWNLHHSLNIVQGTVWNHSKPFRFCFIHIPTSRCAVFDLQDPGNSLWWLRGQRCWQQWRTGSSWGEGRDGQRWAECLLIGLNVFQYGYGSIL